LEPGYGQPVKITVQGYQHREPDPS
jgi:hypothetical protein